MYQTVPISSLYVKLGPSYAGQFACTGDKKLHSAGPTRVQRVATLGTRRSGGSLDGEDDVAMDVRWGEGAETRDHDRVRGNEDVRAKFEKAHVDWRKY